MSEQTKTEHPMTDSKLAEIRARAEAATPNWYEDGNLFIGVDAEGNGRGCFCLDVEREDGTWEYTEAELKANTEFAAHARQDIPWLLDMVAALQERMRELEGKNSKLDALLISTQERAERAEGWAVELKEQQAAQAATIAALRNELEDTEIFWSDGTPVRKSESGKIIPPHDKGEYSDTSYASLADLQADWERLFQAEIELSDHNAAQAAELERVKGERDVALRWLRIANEMSKLLGAPKHLDASPEYTLEQWKTALAASQSRAERAEGELAKHTPPSSDGCNRLNRPAYEKLIAENIEWLKTMPRTLERDHILVVLQDSPNVYYGYPTPTPAAQEGE